MDAITLRQYYFLSRTTVIASIVVAVIALIVIGAWWSGNIGLASVSGRYVPMTLTVAVSVLLLSVAVQMRVWSAKQLQSTWLPSALSVAVLLLSLWILVEFLAGESSGIDRMLGAGSGTVEGYELAQSSPLSIITLLAASAAAVLTFYPRVADRVGMLAVSLSLFTAITGALVTLGYLYGTPLLYGGDVRPVALLSGISYTFLGIMLICQLGPTRWPLNHFLGPSVRARLLRSFLPIVVVMVLLSGSLSNQALATSGNPALTAAMIALLTAIVLGYVVTRMSNYIGGQIDKANATLLKTEDELRQANEKLNVLGSITRHDTLNRLAVVLGRMQMVQEISKDKDVLKQAKESLAAAQAIQNIIEFTGEYQKIGTGGPVWVDVEEAFREALRGVDIDSITIKSEVAGLEVFADRMFEKVLINLVDNSLRYGKNLRTLKLYHAATADGLALVYEDDGGGLSAEDKANLFKRGHGKHTGLGLFLSKEIIDFSGMTIRETGQTGVNARFEITVPQERYRLEKA